MHRSIRWLFVASLPLVLAGVVLAGEAGKSEPPRPGAQGPMPAGLVFPPQLAGRLGLSEEQRGRVGTAAKEFADKNAQALGALPPEMMKIRDAMQQARQKEDREAYGKAQQRARELMQSLGKLRGEFEPSLLAELTDEQKKKYAEAKAEFLNPAPPFGSQQGDSTEGDGTHESPAGQKKVGETLLKFFKTDTTTRGWFCKK